MTSHVSNVFSIWKSSVTEMGSFSYFTVLSVSEPSGTVKRVVTVIGLCGYFSQVSTFMRSKLMVQVSNCLGIKVSATFLLLPNPPKSGPDLDTQTIRHLYH